MKNSSENSSLSNVSTDATAGVSLIRTPKGVHAVEIDQQTEVGAIADI